MNINFKYTLKLILCVALAALIFWFIMCSIAYAQAAESWNSINGFACLFSGIGALVSFGLFMYFTRRTIK